MRVPAHARGCAEMVWQKHCYPDLGRGGAEQRECPPSRDCPSSSARVPPMWGEGIMPIDCLPVGLDCSHEGAVPKCKNIATPISVGAVL